MDATATNAEVEQEAERGGQRAVRGRRSAEEGAGRLWWTRARGKGFTARQRAAAAATTTISLWTDLPFLDDSIPFHSMDNR
jgi:hypothetical protein